MTADFPIPAGYALVPLEPTEAMVEAAKDERMACFKDTALSVGAALARIYKAAVAAAPPIAATGEDLKIYQAIADNYHATAAVVGEPVAESASAFKSRLITDACSKWSGAQKVEAGDIVEWIADYRVAPSPATDPAATLIEALLAVQMSAVAIPDVAGEHAIKTATLAKVERALGAYSLSVPAKDRKRLPVTVCCGRSECGGECGNEWAGMEDARLVGRYRDALAMLAARAVDRAVACSEPLPLMQQAFRTTETEGDPDPAKRRYSMIFGFPSLATLQAAEAEWISTAGARIVQQIADPVDPIRLLAPQPTPPRDVVPGKVHCAKCGFTLQRVNLYMQNGATGPGGEETEPCPNDGTPLLPVTWEQEARESWAMAEQQFDRAHALEAAATELIACKDLKDEESRLRQRRDVAIARNSEATAAVDAMRDDYNRRKPMAWAAMRALLAPTHGSRK